MGRSSRPVRQSGPFISHALHRRKFIRVHMGYSQSQALASVPFYGIPKITTSCTKIQMEEEHEVYGGDIPVEADMDGDMEDSHADEDAAKELDEMKKKLKEMEEEAAALREMQAKIEKEVGTVQDPATSAANLANKEEVDARSVFVGNVDYACTPEEVQQHFQTCGTVNRVTILTDKFGQPKGFAYVEFVEVEAVQEALSLNESELHGRQLKVMLKRTNVPGMKQFRPRRFNPYMGGGFRRPYPPPYYSPYGYGKAPRFRGPSRFMPY